MTVNIYDTANQLEQDLRQTSEYAALKEAYAKVKEDQVAFDLFKQFQELQMTLQQKQMNGEELQDDEIEEAHTLAQKVSEIEAIQGLMEAEKSLSHLVNDLNRIIMKPVQEMYQD